MTDPQPLIPPICPEGGIRVRATRLDRAATTVVGTLLPYTVAQGERVRDDSGVVWSVDASSVRRLVEAEEEHGD